ncbi:MAG: hypothetical protein WCG27_06770, partial [Pseudomonadota bacterium]
MKTLQLIPKYTFDPSKGPGEFYAREFVNFSKGLTPGEWVQIVHKKNNWYWVGIVNPHVLSGPCAYAVENLKNLLPEDEDETIIAHRYIEKKIIEAYARKKNLGFSDNGQRLVHGAADGLPGLLI